MLKINTGHNLKTLADQLLEELDNHPQANALGPELFVVQNHGMARWLSLHVSERTGIAANMQFKFPAEVFWQVLRTKYPDVPENLPSERIPMTWTIFKILQNDFDPALGDLHQYTRSDDPAKQEIRCWQLAVRLGDIFDQYLTYRPEMLSAWLQKVPTFRTANPAERWQAVLWKKLNAYWERTSDWPQRAELETKILQKVAEGHIDSSMLPERISIFGVADMPPVYTKLFVKLAAHTNVHYYLTDLSGNSGHPLIESLGQSELEFRKILNNTVAENEQVSWKRKRADALDAKRPSLFCSLKKDLLGLETTDRYSADETIQIHSCHSPRREVEVLYDQLLRMFDKDSSLNPSDVLVLSPQLDTYEAQISAVFGTTNEPSPAIPYTIAERSRLRIVDSSFIKLMELIDSRFKVTDVLDLLDFRPIRESFSFSMDDVNTLERWIGDTRIRWGIDDQQKAGLGLPATRTYTWRAGLHRMMSGYAMSVDNDQLFERIYPYSEIQQSEEALLLGRFSRFMHALFNLHDKAKSVHDGAAWTQILQQCIEDFFAGETTHAYQLQSLKEAVASLQEQSSYGGFNGEIRFSVIRKYLVELLDRQQTGGGRRGKGVTFSSMISMRNIPAKVIAVIGLDDDAFPRSAKAPGFDLMASKPEPGDRSQAKVDRQMFLESILSAESKLYLSYTGQSNRQDAGFPPSVLVRELTDYIEQKFGILADKLSYKHRLHSFSFAYFDKEQLDGLFSYSAANCNIARSLQDSSVRKTNTFMVGELPEADDELRTITVNDLINFLQHPARYVMNRRFNIYQRDEDVLDNDRDIFRMDGLERYKVGQELLQRYLENDSAESYRSVLESASFLPEGWPGHSAFDEQHDRAKAFGIQLESYFDQKKVEPAEVDYNDGAFRISGRLNDIFENEQLFYRFGSLRAKDRIELWVRHLLFQLSLPEAHSGRSRILTQGRNGGVESCVLKPVSEAEAVISQLLEWYWLGMHEPLLLFAETSFAYAEARLHKDRSEEYALKAANGKWRGRYSYVNEAEDPYNKLYIDTSKLLRDNDLKDLFKFYSIRFWSPFMQHLIVDK